MRTAVIDFSSYKLKIAISASKFLKPSKHLPEYILPGKLFLSKIHNKFIDIPILITLMLGHYISIKVYKYVSFWTLIPFALIACIQ